MTITEDRPLAEEDAIITTTNPTNVIAAVARVMAELGGIDKLTSSQRAQRGMGGGNEGIQYAYRGIDQIAGAAQPLLGRYGVVIVPTLLESRVEPIVVNQRPWTDTWVRVMWDVYGPGGVDDRICATTEGLGRDNADKGMNKAMTSAAKNLLLRLLMIGDSSDDTDGHTYERDQGDDRPKPLSDTWMATWRNQMTEQGVDPDGVLFSAFGNMVPNPLMPEHIPAMRDAVARMKQAQEDEALDAKPIEPPLEQSEDVPPVTRPQIARIKSEHDRLGYDRQQGLEMTSSVVNRDIKTHNQLTWAEAESVIEALAHIKRSDEGTP